MCVRVHVCWRAIVKEQHFLRTLRDQQLLVSVHFRIYGIEVVLMTCM